MSLYDEPTEYQISNYCDEHNCSIVEAVTALHRQEVLECLRVLGARIERRDDRDDLADALLDLIDLVRRIV